MPKRDGKEIRCRSTTLLKIAWNEGDEKSGRGMDGWMDGWDMVRSIRTVTDHAMQPERDSITQDAGRRT